MCMYSHRFGPLVCHWMMRFEAKHSYFKQLAHSMGNFVNITYSFHEASTLSVLSKHQLPGSENNMETGPGYHLNYSL